MACSADGRLLSRVIVVLKALRGSSRRARTHSHGKLPASSSSSCASLLIDLNLSPRFRSRSSLVQPPRRRRGMVYIASDSHTAGRYAIADSGDAPANPAHTPRAEQPWRQPSSVAALPHGGQLGRRAPACREPAGQATLNRTDRTETKGARGVPSGSSAQNQAALPARAAAAQHLFARVEGSRSTLKLATNLATIP